MASTAINVAAYLNRVLFINKLNGKLFGSNQNGSTINFAYFSDANFRST